MVGVLSRFARRVKIMVGIARIVVRDAAVVSQP
jgi:hypothetical protein